MLQLADVLSGHCPAQANNGQSGHRAAGYLTGAALFSAGLAVTMLIFRSSQSPVRETTASRSPVRELEGVA